MPRVKSVATVTTADGFCAGLQVTNEFFNSFPVYNLYDATQTGLVIGTANDLYKMSPQLLHMAKIYTSPDANDPTGDTLAVKIILEDADVPGVTVETMTCGNYQSGPELETHVICNNYSTVTQFASKTKNSNGALTSLTVNSIPV